MICVDFFDFDFRPGVDGIVGVPSSPRPGEILSTFHRLASFGSLVTRHVQSLAAGHELTQLYYPNLLRLESGSSESLCIALTAG